MKEDCIMTNTLYVFDNLNIAACVDGEQVPELQESWIIAWAKKAESLGYDPTTFIIQCTSGFKWQLFKTSEGSYNWRRIDNLPNITWREIR